MYYHYKRIKEKEKEKREEKKRRERKREKKRKEREEKRRRESKRGGESEREREIIGLSKWQLRKSKITGLRRVINLIKVINGWHALP